MWWFFTTSICSEFTSKNGVTKHHNQIPSNIQFNYILSVSVSAASFPPWLLLGQHLLSLFSLASSSSLSSFPAFCLQLPQLKFRLQILRKSLWDCTTNHFVRTVPTSSLITLSRSLKTTISPLSISILFLGVMLESKPTIRSIARFSYPFFYLFLSWSAACLLTL